MFWIYLAIIFTVAGILCLILEKRAETFGDEKEVREVRITMFCLALVLVFICFGWSFFSHSSQISDNEKLIRIDQVQNVYQKRADNLTTQLAILLVEKYPKQERDIFDKIKPENVSIYLAKYPEIQSAQTIMEAAKQTKILQDDIYKQQIERAEILNDMRYRAKSPWVLQWTMPDIKIPEK